MEDGVEGSRALDLLVVDAGSPDTSLAMSCPPPDFLRDQFLEDSRGALGDCGLLAVNCVTRSQRSLKDAVERIKVLMPSPLDTLPSPPLGCAAEERRGDVLFM